MKNLANSGKAKLKNTPIPSKKYFQKGLRYVNSKNIGNIGEIKVISKFVELGCPVYLPFGDNEKAELIAEFNGKLNKIQVKTSIKAEDGKMIFSLVSSTLHRKNGVKHIYTEEEIDYFACYNIARDKIYLIKVKDAPSTGITIRYEKPKNNQTKDIKFEDDYLIENILCVETLHEIPNDQKIYGKEKVQTTM